MANVYSKFLQLIPKNVKTVAKVEVVDNGDGVVMVTLPGTTTSIKVRGDGSNTYAIGDYVYIVDGVIQAKTSTLQPPIEVMVV